MKKSILACVFFLLLAAGCQRIQEVDMAQSPQAPAKYLTAVLEGEEPTKTALSGPDSQGIYYPWWSAEDAVAVYVDGINAPDKYTLADGAGTVKATFKGSLYGQRMVALYPYADKTEEGLSGNVLTLELPAQQEYVRGSFGPDSYPMLAVSTSDALSFKNLCAVLKLSLTGEETVNKITFRAHDNKMAVSGKATVRTDFEQLPELQMAEGGSPEVTLSCGSVTLSKTEVTDFFLVIPAGTYRGGFTVEIKTFAGTVTRSTQSDVTFGRSQFRAIPAFECVGTGEVDLNNIPYNQIWYATSNGQIVNFNSDAFNTPVVSNVYENGWGIVTFEGPLTTINNYALNNQMSIVDLFLPNCVETIGRYALYNLNLTSFRTPDALKSVGVHSLYFPSLTEFTGKWATKDGKGIVLEDGSLVAYAWGALGETLQIPEETISVSNYLFEGVGQVKRVVVPEGVSKIGSNCFESCGALETVSLPSSLVTVDPAAFSYCPELVSFEGSSPLNADGHALVSTDGAMVAFAGKGITDYVIPSYVSTLYYSCFTSCADLKSLTFPSALNNLYSSWMSNCPNVEFFYGPSVSNDHHCLILYGNYLVAVTPVCPVDYVLPGGYNRIFSSVFAGNVTTERLVIPDEVTTIGSYCFEGMTSLKTLQLPASLSNLGSGPFSDCKKLDNIYVRSYSPPSYSEDADWSFIGHDGLTVYVPKGTEEQYKSATGWSKYADYIKGYEYDDLEKPDWYISTDYSQDGVVKQLQSASEGNGINLVFMGDAFSDRQIADGTYDAVINKMVEAFFSEEPYTSYRKLFNVYSVYVVSSTEGYEHSGQALSTWFGDGTSVGGNDSKCMELAQGAVSQEAMDNTLIIVAMNSDAYAGTCWMYYPSGGDYGCGVSVAYFPMGNDDAVLAQLVHHEAGGHGFSKLADEYAYESMGDMPDSEKENRNQMVPYGWWKNCDFTGDPQKVKWARFLADERYRYDGLGCFEGAFTYWTGAWRPTDNSIMRYNTGGFNAPSREAIWYRMHKLAYGENWVYDYEQFVAYDALNRKTASSAPARTSGVLAPMPPLGAPRVVPMTWREAMKR